MDNVSDYETEGSRFDSRLARSAVFLRRRPATADRRQDAIPACVCCSSVVVFLSKCFVALFLTATGALRKKL